MDAQLRGHFRDRFAAIEPQLNSMAFEGFIELLSGLLGLDHRFTHTRLVALCLSYLCPSNRRSPTALRDEKQWRICCRVHRQRELFAFERLGGVIKNAV